MLKNYQRIKYSIFYFIFALAIFFFCRLLFYIFNVDHFTNDILLSFIWGFRYDISAISLIYSPIFVLLMLPAFPLNKGTKKILDFFFYLASIIALFFNLTDTIYFKFTGIRSNAGIIQFLQTGDDIQHLIPKFISDYWYMVLIFLASIFLIRYIYNKIKLPTISAGYTDVYSWFRWLLTISLLVIGFRGGMQLRPINQTNAAQDVNSENIALVLNTPFSFLKTLTIPTLQPKHYMSKKKAEKLFLPIQKINSKGTFKKKNVVVIILESFSKEYIGSFNKGMSFTPFLDSLMNKSMVFENAFANGKTSMEGIPSITASIPTIMDREYIISPYGGNKINSLATVLDKEGYYTAFYHGGDNGTMDFNSFTKIAGYKHYFGRTEYPHPDKDYDGSWGIWDEPYLQYFAQQLNKAKKPFFTTLFTLSSHHPFAVPKKYKNKFPKGEYKILQCVAYTDYALKRFFQTASQMPWYNNTLFVLTADHTSLSRDKFYKNRLGNYTVPIIFFDPGKSKNFQPKQKIMQQADIFPSVLGYLGYKDNVFAFGQNVFNKKEKGFAVQYKSGVYQLIDDNYILLFDGTNVDGLYRYKKDSLLKNNLIGKKKLVADSMENKIKAIIQQYNQHLINNTMTAKSAE